MCSAWYFVRFQPYFGVAGQIFVKVSKFQGNPSCGNSAVGCGQTDGLTDGRTDMTKTIFAFRDFCERAYKST